ncbi:MAG: exopolysaccharide biosynthesis polyprenyl glycosylphosphotransferase [Patescibacteria group bacterium]|nr:exopolysaccharide biosynthesis polyprenyl glycosylphosphotransferase [Patescibacteria group bacterium]MCL5224227.1 exopolysaccharide biosynthesis polyprenyl glycosylphosphotransferase [Patescibacteria group bacterium]
MIRVKQFALVVGDIVLLYGALLLTIYLRYGVIRHDILMDHLAPFSIVFVIWLGLFYSAGWYDIRTLRKDLILLETVIVTLLVGFALAAIIFYSIPYFHIAPKTNLAIFTVIFAIFAFAWRLLISALIKTPRENVLLIGESQDTEEIVDYLNNNPHMGYRVQSHMKSPSAVDVAGLKSIIVNEGISTVVILETEQNKNYVAASLYKNLGTGVEIVPFADFYEMILGKVPLGELREEWFFENVTRRHKGYNFVKRGADVIAGVIVGIFFMVIWLPLYLAVKLTSRGPFIFKQIRVGKNGRPYIHYKVRTMYERDVKERWLDKDARYITPIGKFLRATHIDEVPQFWNALKGDLSFVGPRPDFIDFFEKLEKQIPYYAIRTLVKPGVTGWAQTNYPVTASLEETRVRLSYDLYYLKHYSFMVDLLIVLKTLKTVFTAAGR